jgi:hypothetical protein
MIILYGFSNFLGLPWTPRHKVGLSLDTIGNLSRGIDNNDSLRRNMYTFLKGILYSLTRRGTFIYIYIYYLYI